MKKWQRFWLWWLVAFSLVHTLRDVLQDRGIHNAFSMVLTKQTSSEGARVLGQTIVNTYVVAPVEIVLAVVCLVRRKFGAVGYLTVIVMAVSFSAWVYYWFFL